MGMSPTPPPQMGPGGPGPGGPPPSPTGQLVGRAQPQGAQMIQRLQSAVQDIAAFTQMLQQVSPQAAQHFRTALQSIAQGVTELRKMAGGGPQQPPGQVPAPGPQTQMTPEAT